MTDLAAQTTNKPKNREINVAVEIENGIRHTTLSLKSGDEDARDFKWEGEEMPVHIRQQLDDLQIDVETLFHDEKLVLENTTREEIRTTNEKTIKVIIRDHSGEKVMEWEGDEEMPEEIKKEIEKIKNQEDNPTNLNKIIIRSSDGEEKIFEWEGNEIPEDITKELHESELGELLRSDLSKGKQHRASLGLALALNIEKTIENNVEYTNQSVVIADVITGSGAEIAGIKKDDRLISVNGITIENPKQVVEIINELQPGDIVPLTIDRDSEIINVNVTLTEAVHHVLKQEKQIVIKKEINKNPGLKEDPVFSPEQTLTLEDLKIHPNPSNGQLQISFTSEAAPLTITITDVTGKNLIEKKVDLFDGVYQDQFDLQTFPKGPVFIHIGQNGKNHSEKIIHQ